MRVMMKLWTDIAEIVIEPRFLFDVYFVRDDL